MLFQTIFNMVKLQDKMLIIPSLVRLYSIGKSFNVKPNILHGCSPKLKNDHKILRNIHFNQQAQAKVHYEWENNHLYYNCINHSLRASFAKDCPIEITNKDQFEALLNQNWRLSTAPEILAAFKSLKQFCIDNEVNISDPQFDNLVDGLMDHCEELTDNEILELLHCLAEYPRCDSYAAHNFHDVWSCLDDICCWKMYAWDMDKILYFADAWFMLNLARICDFTWEVLDRHTKKADDLTKDQLVKIFFYFNASRRRKVDFEYEYALQNKIFQMNINEMAVVALGYFKTESKIKMDLILDVMMNEVIKTSQSIHEMTLTAILKTLRLSKPIKLPQKMVQMLDKLTPEIDRLSDIACLHLALVPTGLLIFHEKSLKKCTEKLSTNIENAGKLRIKEIERLLNALTMFNFNPDLKPNIFETSIRQLTNEERKTDVYTYPKSVVSSLNYLSMRNIYSHELMNHVLDVEFVNKNYGKIACKVPRELFSLDCCIDVECPDYQGKRLPLDLRYKAAKWHIEFVPSHNQYKKLTAAEKLMLDIIVTVKGVVKDDRLLYVSHVLPHYPRADIILCKDKRTNKFIEPVGFQRYVLGDIKTPFEDENLMWYAMMILGWNNTIRDTSIPLGHMVMKKRQLKKIGYKPVMVIWNQFMPLSSQEKNLYISNLLK